MKRLLLLAILPATAHAEVMDKEPSAGLLGLFTIAACVIAYQAARRFPWSLVLFLSIAGIYFGAVAVETLDPAIGPAIQREAGSFYLALPWLGICGTVVGTVFGLWRRRCAPNNSFKPKPLRGSA